MKRLFATTVAAAALLCGVTASAHATYICGVPTQMLGKTGTNPVISTSLTRDGVNWSVVHTLRDSTLVERSTQYTMEDHSVGDRSAWSGPSITHPGLWMAGELSNGVYTETLHDNARGDAVVMRSEANCSRYAPTPPSDLPVVLASTPASAPTYAPAAATAAASPVADPANPDLNTKAGFLSILKAAKELGGPPMTLCNRAVCTYTWSGSRFKLEEYVGVAEGQISAQIFTIYSKDQSVVWTFFDDGKAAKSLNGGASSQLIRQVWP